MKLFAKINDPELFLKSLNEQGTAFYRPVEGDLVEAVYFSTSRTVYFIGEISHQQYDILKAQAHRAEKFRINEQLGVIEVSQLEE